jgi:hypothetical protein
MTAAAGTTFSSPPCTLLWQFCSVRDDGCEVRDASYVDREERECSVQDCVRVMFVVDVVCARGEKFIVGEEEDMQAGEQDEESCKPYSAILQEFERSERRR